MPKIAAVAEAMADMDGAFYLMHSLTAGHGFENQERHMATIFGHEAKQAGVKKIVYLGGMVPDLPKLSAHLRSRAGVRRILRSSGVPTIELRAESSSDRGRPRSRCCATSPSDCRSW